MNRACRCVLAILIVFAVIHNSAPLFADEVKAKKIEKRWSGEGELGYVRTTGNTDTMSLNAVMGIGHNFKQWEQKIRFEAFFLKDEGEISSERYAILFLNNYILTERTYLFGRVMYEEDHFAGYDYTVSEALGYGIRLISTDATSLELAGGPGGRHTRSIGGDEGNEYILFINGDFSWKISKAAVFKQEVSVETGQENTRSKSVTGMTAEIVGALAMKLSYALRNDSLGHGFCRGNNLNHASSISR
jgi:putative salt-induced outer membrane protein YdiY